MVKPHAVSVCLDIPIISTLNGDISPIFRLPLQHEFTKHLQNINVTGIYTRDLRQSPCYEGLINIFYGNLKNKRYFSMIDSLYKGVSTFISINSLNGLKIGDFMTDLKGKAEEVDRDGNTLIQPSGVRGVLSAKHRVIRGVEREKLADAEFNAEFLPVVNNFIHTTDSPEEAIRAMNIIRVN
jgi:hypothetical protein